MFFIDLFIGGELVNVVRAGEERETADDFPIIVNPVGDGNQFVIAHGDGDGRIVLGIINFDGFPVFEKFEGVTVNAADGKVYLAMTRMRDGMEDRPGDPANHIRIPKLIAGAVYDLIRDDGAAGVVMGISLGDTRRVVDPPITLPVTSGDTNAARR